MANADDTNLNDESSRGENEFSSVSDASGATDVVRTGDNRTKNDETKESRSLDGHSETGVKPFTAALNDSTSVDDEVSEILLRGATDGAETQQPETETETETETVVDSDVVTEIIMSKTFTESIAPDREFIPITVDIDETSADVVADPKNGLPASAAEPSPRIPNPTDTTMQLTNEQSGEVDSEANYGSSSLSTDVNASVSDDASGLSTLNAVGGDDEDPGVTVSVASEQARDLAGDFRRLQELLDDLSSPLRKTTAADIEDGRTSSSPDECIDNVANENDAAAESAFTRKTRELTRVVYRYRIHEPPQNGKRWIRRHRSTDDDELADVSVPGSNNNVPSTAAKISNSENDGRPDDDVPEAQPADSSTEEAIPEIGGSGCGSTDKSEMPSQN